MAIAEVESSILQKLELNWYDSGHFCSLAKNMLHIRGLDNHNKLSGVVLSWSGQPRLLTGSYMPHTTVLRCYSREHENRGA
jgi:hypothetical protein